MTSVTAQQIEQREVQWFAVRMKPNASGGPRTAIVDVEKEQYTNRAGARAWRKVKGTGTRVFLPEHLLKRAGFEVFLPVKKVLRIKNRFTKEKHLVAVPLLADWMFVGLPIVEGEYGRMVQGWTKLMHLDVVAGVMGTGGRPVRMTESTMVKLMRQYSSGRVNARVKRRVAERRGVFTGDAAIVLAGPFEGFPVRVVDVTHDMARGLVNLFGRDQLLEFGLEDLSKK